MAKQLIYDVDVAALKRGVDAVANAVRITLGLKGRNVVLDKKFGSPTITNDGVTIAKEIELEQPFENMGAQLVKEVASKTNDIAGDGTTTATVLAQALIEAGLRQVGTGANPILLKRGIDKGVAAVVEAIKARRCPSPSGRRSPRWRRSPPPTPRSVKPSPTPWRRWARTGSSRSRSPRAWRPS